MKNKEQTKAKNSLKKNFFREALLRELNLEYKRQLSRNSNRLKTSKKLSTCEKSM